VSFTPVIFNKPPFRCGNPFWHRLFAAVSKMTSSQAEVIRQAANVAESRYRRRLREQRRTFSGTWQQISPAVAEAAPDSPDRHLLAPDQTGNFVKPGMMPLMVTASPARDPIASTPDTAVAWSNATCTNEATRAATTVPGDGRHVALALDDRPVRYMLTNDGLNDPGPSAVLRSPSSSSSPSDQSAENIGWPEADALDLELSTSSSEGRSRGASEESDDSADYALQPSGLAATPRKRMRSKSATSVKEGSARNIRSWRQGTNPAERLEYQKCLEPSSGPRPKILTMWDASTKHIEHQVAAALFAREYSGIVSPEVKRRGS
jgi:hypothetical protein